MGLGFIVQIIIISTMNLFKKNLKSLLNNNALPVSNQLPVLSHGVLTLRWMDGRFLNLF